MNQNELEHWESRAEAAEAEVAKYAAILSEANTNRIGMIELNGRLHAEVARLREEALRLYNSDGSFVRLESPEAVVKNRIRAAQKSVKATDRIAELEAALTEIANYAQERSQGPTVFDALWDVRSKALMALRGEVE